MKTDDMRSVVTFTIFSFLLLTIAMFLVFYRYDLYNMDSGTSIQIGFIVEKAKNRTEMGADKSREQRLKKEEIQGDQYNHSKNAQRDSVNQEGSMHPSAGNTQIFKKIIAILATESHQPAKDSGQKSPSGVDLSAELDPIRRMISKLGESRDGAIAPVHKADLPITKVETIPFRPTLVAGEEKATAKIPSILENPKRSGGSTTRSPGFKESEHNRQVLFPPERLPSPIPAASPPKSWPSSFLPDSGFANSAEISPFSLFSRFANFMKPNEDYSVQPEDDSQEMWPQLDDLTDIFGSPGNAYCKDTVLKN
uniref:Uncharacterized protein n=1 Tax=Lygus hesperus TaxID=30085 RepID=A0A0K8TAS9_LYGHE